MSSESFYEDGSPFTLQQVEAACSFTAPKTDKVVIAELPGSSTAFRLSRRDTAVQASVQYPDQSTQATPSCKEQAVQVTPHYQDTSTQVAPSYHDQSTQLSVTYENRETQIASHYTEQAVQYVSEERIPAVNAEQCAPDPHVESQSSLAAAFFTARNCSTAGQGLEPHPLVDVSLDHNVITIIFPESIEVRMLRSVQGDKIVVDPARLSRAASSEALAQGEVYTPSYVRGDQEAANILRQRYGSRSSSTFSSNSAVADQRRTSLSNLVVPEASGTAENSHYAEAGEHLTSLSQPEEQFLELTPQVDQDVHPSTAKVDLAADSSAQPQVNGKRRASSVPYWFQSEDGVPEQPATPPARPQTLSQFRSVPLIRIQRPSTDSTMVFGVGTKAVKSTSPVPPAADVPAVPVGNPDASPPNTRLEGHTHRHGRGGPHGRPRDRDSNGVLPVAVDRVGFRTRLKHKGSIVGRKGRQKIVFRKRVLRVLLGKELAATVQTLQTTGENAVATVQTLRTTGEDAVATVQTLQTIWQDAVAAANRATTATAPAQIDGSHDERKTRRQDKVLAKRQKKAIKQQAKYTLAKTNNEALLSTPCVTCRGQTAYVLRFVYENKLKMLKHEFPEMRRRTRKYAAKAYVAKMKCTCAEGTPIGGPRAPEALPERRDM